MSEITAATQTASGRITAVIAEDEQIFRDAIVRLVRAAWPELEIVATCADGNSALAAISEHQPTIAFLDIRMPGLTGLEVATALVETSPETQVVFVTAYDQYALNAFESGAVDYLLKPVEEKRLAATIERLKKRVGSEPPDTVALAALVRKLGGALDKRVEEPPLEWITASVGKETRLISVDDVIYFQSDSKYTVVMTADGEALLRTPLKDIVGRLNPTYFKQVHRATVVNLRAVAAVTRDESGRGTLRLKQRPETLAVSLTFMPLFKNM
ncbi:MAG: response regulator transcription factor [Betaproteobacteria bacterium]|nr:response regulator transcription factor [Betaproteobacteria bacterium]